MTEQDVVVSRTFRALVESAERKFARVRDVPAYGHVKQNHYFHKVFKAYMGLWKYQQENRSRLVDSGLQRSEIGEIASRIAQLYFGQYMRTSEARFLLESYIFYEAILNRGYFQGSKGLGKDLLGLRYKELRFYARFLLVCLILARFDMVKLLMDRFSALVDDSKATFRDNDLKEWKVVVHEIVRFMKVNTAFMNTRPLRYCSSFDSHADSIPFVARYHAKKMLKFQNAVLASYHRSEVKFAEITLDTYRMLQCLEREPGGSFYQKRPAEPYQNGFSNDQSGPSGIIDINLAMDMTDPTLPPNPKKAVLYRPSVTHLISVIASVCEELPSDSVMLIYLSALGKRGNSTVSQTDSSGGSRKSSKKAVLDTSREQNSSSSEAHLNEIEASPHQDENFLWFGPKGKGGSNNLYVGDIIPFTRRPLFLIIDSDNSHAFKDLHGKERGETTALLLSPHKVAFKNRSRVDTQNGSQFTLFLTAPLQALCQLVDLSYSNPDSDDGYNEAESIISSSFSEWEVMLCTSTNLDLVWAQVLSDPFLRRLILRFIFCRAVLHHFSTPEDGDQYIPVCLPNLPSSLSPNSRVVQSSILRLTKHLRVAHHFHF